MKLDDSNPMPLYYQLEIIIRKRVEEGIYKPDEKIPSERRLSEEFNLSRMTISKAINNLVEEGILYRKRGKGTFVSKNKVDFFPGLMGFTEIMEKKGMKPSSKVISQAVILPDKYLCEKLQILENEKVIFTQRLRLADNEIINLEKSYVPYSLCPKLLEINLSVESIYKLLTTEGYKPSKAEQEIQAILSDNELSKLLKINIDEPILKRKRITYSKNVPIEYSLNYYRGDIYTMVMTINS
ncbi:GntR family transcriptional regulator [Crassaminicella thermophila]|uniref:GntR family transcriptional regulator n=1 Tax=Crassaminicella thermophila TaxID=2599308 RepID=A0A5C0SHA1_CRATE|nr:GntR family transcriptional regulator [Crassaminicella thermophila]QEK13106.1 GntR family transcriptional regulator [Crassaminicella thermophila]